MTSSRHNQRLGNLPAETTSFVDRRAERAHLGGLLEQDRLVTLTGVGGVGKTRLALRAASEAQPRFPDGVWLVELSPLRDPALLEHVILEAIPLADQTTRPVQEVLIEWLADKQLLLVLDSCEHLIDACSHAVDMLLETVPEVRILATSRQPLDLPAEREVVVQPLSAGDPQRGSGAERNDAVELFVERAMAAAPGFVLDEKDQKAVDRICWHLDGIPLAIELAVAQLSELSVEELGERLHSRFELLTSKKSRGGLARHQTLRTTIGWSHELCAPLERLLWARLSVFVGGFDAEAAEEVCSGGPLTAHHIPKVLNALVDKSIILRREQADHDSGSDRYRMLDTVREYGGHWLRELGEEEQTQRRHRDYYLRLAQQGDALWMGPDQVGWYQRTVAEHANLRAALDFSLTEPEGGHTALEMAAALWFFWYCCGFLREGRRYLEQALAADPQPSPARTQALWACAVVAFTQGDHEIGLQLGLECQQAARQQGDPDAIHAAAYPVAASLLLLGKPVRGLEVCDQVPPVLVGRCGGCMEASQLLSRLSRAYAHIVLGEFDRAVALTDEVRAECSARGEQWVRGYADATRAQADFGGGDAASAAAHARAAVKGWRPLHNTSGIAVMVDQLASAVAAQGEGERAARLLGIAQQLWQMIGRPQMGSPEFIAARAECERQARDTIGDVAYEAAYNAGLEMDPDDGIAYALTAPPHDARTSSH